MNPPSAPNHAAAGNAGLAPGLHIREYCPGVPEPGRSAQASRGGIGCSTAAVGAG
jgi:hypothetical protein